MKDLQIVLENLKTHSVQTYIQTGNNIFESDGNLKEKMFELISRALYKEFGYVFPVLVLEKES